MSTFGFEEAVGAVGEAIADGGARFEGEGECWSEVDGITCRSEATFGHGSDGVNPHVDQGENNNDGCPGEQKKEEGQTCVVPQEDVVPIVGEDTL